MSAFAAEINADTYLTSRGFSAVSNGAVLTVTNNWPWAVTNSAWPGYYSETCLCAYRNGASKNIDYQYNTNGLVTRTVDEMGRSVAYTYAANNIDVLQATEVLGTDNSSLGSWTYNTQHLPLTYTDGSGQVTHYSYNSSGQLLTLTDANSNVTKLTYTGSATATIGGTKTTGDILTITVHDAGLTGGQEAVNYTVLSTDTLTTIAAGLTAAINADAHLSSIGVRATSAAAVITLLSTSVNFTSYTESVSTGATETITLTAASAGYLTQVDGPLQALATSLPSRTIP